MPLRLSWWLVGIRRVLSVFQGRPTFRWLKPYRPHPSLPVVFIYHTCGPISPHVYNEIKMVTFCNTLRGLYWRSFSPHLAIVATASRCRCFTHCFKKLNESKHLWTQLLRNMTDIKVKYKALLFFFLVLRRAWRWHLLLFFTDSSCYWESYMIQAK